MKELISRLSMKIIDCEFIDKVNGKEVFRWVDKNGINYLAQNRFGTRIKANQS